MIRKKTQPVLAAPVDEEAVLRKRLAQIEAEKRTKKAQEAAAKEAAAQAELERRKELLPHEIASVKAEIEQAIAARNAAKRATIDGAQKCIDLYDETEEALVAQVTELAQLESELITVPHGEVLAVSQKIAATRAVVRELERRVDDLADAADDASDLIRATKLDQVPDWTLTELAEGVRKEALARLDLPYVPSEEFMALKRMEALVAASKGHRCSRCEGSGKLLDGTLCSSCGGYKGEAMVKEAFNVWTRYALRGLE